MKLEIVRVDVERKFDELCNKVRFCTRCSRMEDSARVLSRAAGPTSAEVMFVGEAPGRLGADASEIPFHGDKAGHNFEELLRFAGFDRSTVYVTNAVLCNPKAEDGNNSTPNKSEVMNCAGYLREQIDLIQPKVVVALGATALEALSLVAPHSLRLGNDVRSVHSWYGRTLIPLYHPGARAMVHRSMANQRSDYQFVAEQVRRLFKRRSVPSGATQASVASVAAEVLRRRGSVSYFALHKILYLIECEAWVRLGHRLTSAFFLRQKDGPYCTDLHLAKLRKALPDLRVSGDPQRPLLRLPQAGMFEHNSSALPPRESAIVNDVLERTSELSDAELKSKVYLSSPMRNILRMEKAHLINLYNSPIRFDVPTKNAI